MIKVFGADGSYSHDSKASSFLIDDKIAIDAGNIIQEMGEASCRLEHIFISHTHFDHILDLPFIIESYIECRKAPLKVYALRENITRLKEYLFNWDIWPDFETIDLAESKRSSLEFVPVAIGETITIDDITLTVIKANHTVPTFGLKVAKGQEAFVFSGDTYLNPSLIELLDSDRTISSLLIDVSFSSEKEKLAQESKHLTPKLLDEMLRPLKRDDLTVYTYHQKPYFTERIDEELVTLGLLRNGGKRLETGDTLDLFTPIVRRKDVSVSRSILNEREHLKNLFKISQRMQSELNPSILLEMIVEQAKVFTQADGSTLYMLDSDRQELVFKIAHNDTLGIHIDSRHTDVSWPNLPLFLEDGVQNTHMVASLAALSKEVIMIEDAYDDSDFDFDGTKRFDQANGYRSQSMLVVPLLDHEEKVIAVLQLINKIDSDGKTTSFDQFDLESTKALASQAAVAIVNSNLIKHLEESFELFIKTVAQAIDSKSHHTGEHVRRVAKIADMLAKAIDKSSGGHYQEIHYNEDDYKQIHLAALLHDVGKITTPEYIMDKAHKLTGIFDRIEMIDERIEVLKRDVRIASLEAEISLLKAHKDVPSEHYDKEAKALQGLDEIRTFLRQSNIGTEFLEDDKITRLHKLAETTYMLDGKETTLLRGDELENLSIRKGTLTEEERAIINDHAKATVEILSAIPFPARLRRVPDIASNHHERLDGSGHPRRLTADDLTLEDRILIMADLFEALSASNRSYKKANSMREISDIIQHLVDLGHLDGDLASFLFDSGVYREYAKVELKAGQQETIQVDFSRSSQ